MRNTFRISTICINLVTLALVSPVWAQVGNSTVTGLATDPSDARIPGVTVTATNKQTGVQTTALTNESGVYNMPNLIPGTYTLRGSLPGFQTQIFENVDLGGNQTRRFNFKLQVASVATQVEVSVNAQELLTQAGGTVGETLANVRELPVFGNDTLDLVNALPGVQLAPAGTLVFGDSNQTAGASRWTTIAGISATYTNTSVNGINVTDNFYAGIGEPDDTSGILSITRINPEMIGEMRLISTPVDAEMGRGNAQIQLTTRSGTDRFAGMVRWDLRNPALNARTWVDHSTTPEPAEPWYNQNQITASYGGPIIRNKTFFFALYDQQIHRQRTPVNNTVLSPCARNGIFRYFPGWVNGNVFTPTPAPTSAENQSRASVDLLGNPVRPVANPDGSAYTDSLRYVSVFGPIDFSRFPTNVAPDCSNIPLVNGSITGGQTNPANAWDVNRFNSDRTGFVSKLFGETPLPNNFEIGDGLNTAGNRYVRRQNGADGGGFFGAPATTSDNTNRKQINVKIDHIFSSNHKLSSQLSYERDDADGFAPLFQTGFWGTVERRPLTFSANLNSTLSPSMLNEVRFGLRRTSNNVLEAMDNPQYSDAARKFFPTINGIPTIVTVPLLASPMLGFADNSQGNTTRTLSFSDTLTWTRGVHSWRFGGDFRTTRAEVYNNPNLIPRATGSAGAVPVLIASCGNCTFEGLLDNDANYGAGNGKHFQAGNQANLENLLLLQSGSLGLLQQYYFAKDVETIDTFQSYSSARSRFRTWRENEASFFFQDDWKITRDLTLNLGLRWEYYGPPWEANGLLPVAKGSNLKGAFGISGDNWDDWWQANPKTNGEITTIELAGPNSPNPKRPIYKKDKNNFGPVLGFAWNVPWFGQGKTVLRGGFSITYQGGGNFTAIDGTASGDVPGAALQATFPGLSSTYLRLADFGTNYQSLATPSTFNFRDYPIKAVVPLPVDQADPSRAIRPLAPQPIRFRPLGGIPSEFYDDNYLAPYVQNFTLGITRSIGRKMTVDIRYVGTTARKLFSEQPVNSPNFLTNGLKDAFDLARAGGESTLLNDLTSSVNGSYGGSGATWLRQQTGGCPGFTPISMADSLARGDYAAVADCLAYTNGTQVAGAPSGTGIQVGQPQEVGLVLKRSVNARFPNGVQDNFIIANPQFGNLNIVTNANKTNYHSLQTQFTLRPTLGITYQGTFTWSRLLGSPVAPNTFGAGTGYVAYYSQDRRNEDYGVQFQHRRLDFRSHGNFILPFGPGKPFLRDSSGWVARLVEDWQVSGILNITTGIPMTIVGRSGLYESRSSSNFAAFTPETTVAPVDLTPEGFQKFGNFTGIGKVEWKEGAVSGTYFPGQTFARASDPQCAGVGDVNAAGISLRARCNNGLSALAVVNPDGTQTLVAQNAQPGTRGNLGANTMEGPGRWSLDTSLSKGIRLDETKKLQVRFDATNILNHPLPCSPAFCNVTFPQTNRGTNLQLNGLSPFGVVGLKNGQAHRQFQATLRLEF